MMRIGFVVAAVCWRLPERMAGTGLRAAEKNHE